MIDKITTVHRSKLGQRIGKVSTIDEARAAALEVLPGWRW